MIIIKLTQKEVDEILSSYPFIKESTVLSDDAKKTFATILNCFNVREDIAISDYLICPNSVLSKGLGFGSGRTLKAVQELIQCNLISRSSGKSRTHGEKATASVYTINWDNIDKEVVKESVRDRIERLKSKSPETPIWTANPNTNPNTNSNTNINSNIDTNTDNNTNIDNNNKNKKIDMVILSNNDLNYYDYLNNYLNKTADTSDECPPKEEKAVAVDNTVPQEELSFNDVFPSLEEIERRKEEKRQALTQHIKELEQSKELQEALEKTNRECDELYAKEQAEQYFKRWGTYPDGWNTDSKKKELVPAAEEVLPF